MVPATAASGNARIPRPRTKGCEDFLFVEDGACRDEACATGDLESRLYKAWKAAVREETGMGEDQYDAQVLILKIYEPVPKHIGLEYVLILGDVRLNNDEDFSFELQTDTPTDAELADIARSSVQRGHWPQVPASSSVCAADVQAAFDDCAPGIVLDWCRFGYDDTEVAFLASGVTEVDPAANKCLRGEVDLLTAELRTCVMEPCFVEI